MASSRKKQDENNLKTLRELGALPQNKFCFDCGQRGPTYVNVTIGSFVCTKCSGILRGLTPPHRVKSISMATFTIEEIDTLRSKGNDYCRKLWLGLYEGPPPTFSDEQQVRDFMIEKYERKRYYLEKSMTKPEVPNTRPWSSPTLNGSNLKMTNGTKNGLTKSSTNTNLPNGGFIMNGTSRSRPEVKNHNCINNNLGNNFAVDFDKADIFSNTSTSNKELSQSSQQNGFADFEHNTVYTATSNTSTNDDAFSIFDLDFSTMNGPTINQMPLFPRCTSNRWSMPNPATLSAWAVQHTPVNTQSGLLNGGGTATLINSNKPPIDDKYAALKDLDNEMKQQQQDVWSTSNTGSTGSLYSSSTPTTGSAYGSPSPQGSIFGSPSQGQFMSAFVPLQENATPMGNPFNSNTVSNPWANTNGFSNGFSNGSNGFTNNTPNGFASSGINGVSNGVNSFNGLNHQGFANPFRDLGKANGFSNILQPGLPVNDFNGMSNGWGGNPFKAGSVATMNTSNPFL